MSQRAIHLQRQPSSAPPRWRWMAATLLAAFALGQGLALAHADGFAHDHEGPCAACRILGENASAIAPSVAAAPEDTAVADVAATETALDVPSEPGLSQAPRAPPV